MPLAVNTQLKNYNLQKQIPNESDKCKMQVLKPVYICVYNISKSQMYS